MGFESRNPANIVAQNAGLQKGRIRANRLNPRYLRSNSSHMSLLHENLTDSIIGAFYRVYNYLGYGFLEKVYENSLRLELEVMGIKAVCQKPIKVYYRNQIVGEYFADMVVEDKVILEIKAAEAISQAHSEQLINYLKATDIEVGLLLNFGKKAEFTRRIFEISKRNPATVIAQTTAIAERTDPR